MFQMKQMCFLLVTMLSLQGSLGDRQFLNILTPHKYLKEAKPFKIGPRDTSQPPLQNVFETFVSNITSYLPNITTPITDLIKNYGKQKTEALKQQQSSTTHHIYTYFYPYIPQQQLINTPIWNSQEFLPNYYDAYLQQPYFHTPYASTQYFHELHSTPHAYNYYLNKTDSIASINNKESTQVDANEESSQDDKDVANANDASIILTDNWDDRLEDEPVDLEDEPPLKQTIDTHPRKGILQLLHFQNQLIQSKLMPYKKKLP